MNEVSRTDPIRVNVSIPGSPDPQQARANAATVESVPPSGKKLPPDSRESITANQEQVMRDEAKRVEEAVSSLNSYARSTQRQLQFSVDNDLGRPVVRVVDSSTQEVIRQIPSDVALNLARNLQNNLEHMDMQRAAQAAGVDQFVGTSASLGLVNMHA
ncbi:MAG: flagellar protein FlaG [Pseudomonadales bacterium]|nr:flagellar protein FlaG [Pseudomonadales bacterium]MCP5184735.1 flagellar protein FlaG [Pseudomonadales bacterium]